MVARSMATMYNRGTIFTEVEVPRSYVLIVAMDERVQVCLCSVCYGCVSTFYVVIYCMSTPACIQPTCTTCILI